MTTVEELGEIVAGLHQKYEDRFAVQDARIKELADELGEWQAIVTRLFKKPAANGTFPPLKDIEKLVVQVFHKPVEMDRSRRHRGTTGWSLRIEYWQDGNKRPAINIKMTQPKIFLSNLKNPVPNETPPSNMILRRAQLANGDESGAVAGIVRRKTMGGGSPYVPSQVVIMSGHEQHMEDVVVCLMIGDETAAITPFRIAAGTKTGHALWIGSWMHNS